MFSNLQCQKYREVINNFPTSQNNRRLVVTIVLVHQKSPQIVIFLIILAIYLLIGNVLVVAVVYRNKTLRAAVHYFIANMAISRFDLVIPMANLSWKISNAYNDSVWLVD